MLMSLVPMDGKKKKGGKGKTGGKKGAKGKKGGKKGAKGKKRGKGKKPKKKKVVLTEAPVDRPPTPPTIAEINKLTFENEMDFFNFTAEVKFKEPTYVLFCCTEFSDISFDFTAPEDIAEEASSEALTIECWIEEYLIEMERHHLSRNINYIVVYYNHEEFAECYAHSHPAVQLKELPTFMRWDSHEKLEGEECTNILLVTAFLDRENQRNTTRYIDDGSVCPFYTPPPPEPEPPSKPKKKKKKVKGKKGKGKGKKGKGKKGKGKKGKGKGKKGKGKQGKGKDKKVKGIDKKVKGIDKKVKEKGKKVKD